MTDPSKLQVPEPSTEKESNNPTAPLVNVTSASTTSTSTSSSKPPTSTPDRPSSSHSWRSKLHIHSGSRRSKSVEPGKERWRDATLPEKERWKDWQKAKDKEQMAGSTIGAYTQFYKGKGSTGYWVDVGF
ncbi:hypothetical protein J4E85_001758 [Alternaria conjuncta]|uniref:uncharacterized protein n=1 Tax=Alternaria conjuncta TaxID=181017 RepID=UPI00221FFDEF|nr:uncharacterized protein J4E85_001758 [Alternaria conjuncta]KAI4936428.1 hypothetical protein J4E85_001758 [Alternaria conjuncta]